MDRKKFMTGIVTLGSALPPRKPVEDAVLELYWMALNDLTDDEFAGSVARAARECTFMPAPAELRAFARPPRNLAREAETAWEAVRGAIDRIDYTADSVDFGPVVNACVRQLGGWDALCQAKVSELNVWLPKEFRRLYELFAERPVGDMGRPCPGGSEGRGHGDFTVKIPGIPSQPGRGLPARGEDPGAIRGLIGSLAEKKSV